MIPDDFEGEALYAPEAWFVHDVLEIDADGGRVVGLIDTTRLGALVEAQRTHPGTTSTSLAPCRRGPG